MTLYNQFVVTEDIKQQVKECARAGMPIVYIARTIGCSIPTFKKYTELSEIYDKEKANLIKKCGKTAIDKALEGDERLLMFVLKTQARWTEQSFVKLDNFAGKSFHEQKESIDRMLARSELSIENYQKLISSVTSAYTAVEYDLRLRLVEDKCGLTSTEPGITALDILEHSKVVTV